jgi:hypothetical protein
MNEKVVIDVAAHAAEEAHKAILRVVGTLPDAAQKAAAYMLAGATIAGKVEAHCELAPELAAMAATARELSRAAYVEHRKARGR